MEKLLKAQDLDAFLPCFFDEAQVLLDHGFLDLLQGTFMSGIGGLDQTAADDSRHAFTPFRLTMFPAL